MNTIEIHHFGPIGEGYDGAMPIYPVTIICGDQGAGKSTVAKLISTFAWMEKALVRGDIALNKKTDSNGYFRQRLEFHRIHNYLKENSVIHYSGIHYNFHYSAGNFSIEERNDGANWYDWLWITVHSPDSLSAEQKRYIRRLITLANEGIYSSDKTNAEWDKYIDIDTLAIFYIIQEIMDNVESFSGSCYMHKNRGDDTKLLFGPVWDFGNSFNRGTNSTCHFIYEQPTNYFPHWIEEITKFPKFQLKVRRLWRQIYPSIVTEWGIDNFIDEFVDSFRGAINDDDVRWNRGTNLDDEKERFRYFFHSKVAWLDSQWNFDEYIDPDPQEPS